MRSDIVDAEREFGLHGFEGEGVGHGCLLLLMNLRPSRQHRTRLTGCTPAPLYAGAQESSSRSEEKASVQGGEPEDSPEERRAGSIPARADAGASAGARRAAAEAAWPLPCPVSAGRRRRRVTRSRRR